MRKLLVSLLTLSALPAYGSIIVFSGAVNVLSSPPASVMQGQLLSDTTIYGFNEQQNVVLTANINAAITSPGTWICCSGLPGGTIAAGETVNSYLLRAAPASSDGTINYQGSITFSPGEKILGIIIGYANIAATDAELGAPGTLYPPGTYQFGGLENHDQVILSANLRSVYVDFNVLAGNMDMIRILTETPEPADFLLLGSGLIALAIFRRRLGFSR